MKPIKKIFAVDTATSSCSVALIQNKTILAEKTRNDGQTHSVNLVPMIETLIDQCNLKLKDLDGFAVSLGPGTFTGLRIGISTVKGMAYGSDKPIIGVNSLDALALPLMKYSFPIVSMIDARRGEIYYAVYNKSVNDKTNSNRRKVFYDVAPPEKAIFNIPDNSILIGSGAITYSNFFRKELNKIKVANYYNTIKASSVALIAAKRLSIGDIDKIETLVPNYIRKSDAQIHK